MGCELSRLAVIACCDNMARNMIINLTTGGGSCGLLQPRTEGGCEDHLHSAPAASWQPAGAAPVSGSIRGDGAVAELDFEIQLTTGP